MAVEYRWAQGQNDRLPGLAAELIQRRVAVIAAFGPPAAVAAKAATATIPIIFVVGTDPVDLGLVTSIRRPTSNLTGVNIFAEVLTPKRQELLRELVPTAPLVAMLVNPTSAQTQSELRDVQAAADKLGQQVRIFNVGTDGEIDAAFATVVDQRIGGLLVQTDQFFTSRLGTRGRRGLPRDGPRGYAPSVSIARRFTSSMFRKRVPMKAVPGSVAVVFTLFWLSDAALAQGPCSQACATQSFACHNACDFSIGQCQLGCAGNGRCIAICREQWRLCSRACASQYRICWIACAGR